MTSEEMGRRISHVNNLLARTGTIINEIADLDFALGRKLERLSDKIDRTCKKVDRAGDVSVKLARSSVTLVSFRSEPNKRSSGSRNFPFEPNRRSTS
jgi:hypothetical protein